MPTPEIYCAITVACAAPATALFNPTTNQRSSTMFSTEETAKKTSGTTELPMALKYEAKKLYRKMAGIPKKTKNR